MRGDEPLEFELDCVRDNLAGIEVDIEILIHKLHSKQLQKERLIEHLEDLEAVKESQAKA